jgi:hypothetical protein
LDGGGGCNVARVDLCGSGESGVGGATAKRVVGRPGKGPTYG